MSYIEQKNEWLKKHHKATQEQLKLMSEAWEAGYMTATDNWCQKRR